MNFEKKDFVIVILLILLFFRKCKDIKSIIEETVCTSEEKSPSEDYLDDETIERAYEGSTD